MAVLIITILFVTFSVLLFKDYKKWIPLILAVIYFVLPKEACMIGGAKPNILILFVMIAVILLEGTLKKLLSNRFLYVILFYVIFSSILSCFSIDNVSFISQILFLIKKTCEMFLLGSLVYAFFSRVDDFSKFSRTFYIVVLVGSLYGIFSYVTRSNPYMSFVSSSFRDGIVNGADFFLEESRGVIRCRISGFANHPLTWGQLHLLFLIVLPFFRKYISQRLFFCTLILSSINIIFTGSRSSFVPLIIFLFGYFFVENRKSFFKILSVSGIVFVLFIILGLFFNSEYVDTIRAYVCFWDETASEKVSVSGSSVSMREDQFDNALYFIGQKRLLFGFGYGFVSNMSEDHFMREYLLGFESIILKIVVEQGVLGVISYILMFIFMCVSLMRQRYNIRDRLLIVLMFVSYFLSLLFTGERSTFQLFFLFVVMIQLERNILYREVLKVLKKSSLLAKTN